MKKEKLERCPACGHELTITEYTCKSCDTVIKGDFKVDKFSVLDKEDRDFIELFVMKRGSLKEMEKALGLSYPTVRAKLDSVIEALGHTVDHNASKIDILNQLDEGSISPEEATRLLKYLSNKEGGQ